MARENSLQVIGNIRKIEKNLQDGTTLIELETFRRGNRIDTPEMVVSKDKVHLLEGLEVGDTVQVKGFLGTIQYRKKYTCESCKEDFFIDSFATNILCIDLIKMDRVERNHMIEFNNVWLLGTVCKEPMHRLLGGKTPNTIYQMIIPRKYKVSEQMNITADFPFITSLARVAVDDFKMLRKGAKCFVNGGVQTRMIYRDLNCTECNSHMKVSEKATEICPYGVEYLSGCAFDAI